MADVYDIDESTEELSEDELEQLKQAELSDYYQALEDRATVVESEFESIVSVFDSDYDSDEDSLVKLSKLDYVNPLNPKTEKI